jgi:hypothetical protein
MKIVATFATLALACALTGCASNKANDTAAPGAVNGKACCSEGAAKGAACCKEGEKAAPGAVSGSGCCKDKAAAPGAVSGSSCSKSCTDKAAAPGAVSGKAGGCCASKSGCSSAK